MISDEILKLLKTPNYEMEWNEGAKEFNAIDSHSQLTIEDMAICNYDHPHSDYDDLPYAVIKWGVTPIYSKEEAQKFFDIFHRQRKEDIDFNKKQEGWFPKMQWHYSSSGELPRDGEQIICQLANNNYMLTTYDGERQLFQVDEIWDNGYEAKNIKKWARF